MCGRFTIAVVIGLYERFCVTVPPGPLVPRYNIAPSQDVPVIFSSHDRVPGNTCEMMSWGLLPSWSRDPIHTPRPINARTDSLWIRPMFRDLVRDRRCLVPATGFYEWKKTGHGKIPYYVRMKEASLFAIAGLFDRWRASDGTELATFTLITTGSNELVSPLHDRMPAILRKEDEDAWIEQEIPDPAWQSRALQPYPAEEMIAYPVSTMVNSPGNEGEELIKPEEGLFRWEQGG